MNRCDDCGTPADHDHCPRCGCPRWQSEDGHLCPPGFIDASTSPLTERRAKAASHQGS